MRLLLGNGWTLHFIRASPLGKPADGGNGVGQHPHAARVRVLPTRRSRPKTTTFAIKHNGSYLQWESSDSSIDAVNVKGGDDANVFYYQPETPVSEDEGLHAPMNCGQCGNGLCGISHVTFCYDWNEDDDDDEDDDNQWCAPGY